MKWAKLLGFSIVAAIGVTMVAPLSAEQNKTPVAYFMKQIPADIDVPNHLPSNAEDVIVAKVRLGQGLDIAWLGGRHCEGCTNDIFASRVQIVEVLTGSARVGQIFNVLFGQRSERREFIAYPSTPDQRSQQYTVVIYLGEDGKRRLVPFPISQLEYEKWNSEMRAYQRVRSISGFREWAGARLLLADSVAKVPKRCANNFPRKRRNKRQSRSMQPQTRYRNRP